MPIETCYNGYRFRSRLEARWAVFYDALGIKYLYEPEGFDLGGGEWYLPDFYLPEYGYFIEVKPYYPEPSSLRELEYRLSALCHPFAHDWDDRIPAAFVFFGGIPYPSPGDTGYPDDESALAVFWSYGGDMAVVYDSSYWWCACPVCGYLDLQYRGRGERISWCGCSPEHHKYGTEDTPRLRGAYEAARSARFEHKGVA